MHYRQFGSLRKIRNETKVKQRFSRKLRVSGLWKEPHELGGGRKEGGSSGTTSHIKTITYERLILASMRSSCEYKNNDRDRTNQVVEFYLHFGGSLCEQINNCLGRKWCAAFESDQKKNHWIQQKFWKMLPTSYNEIAPFTSLTFVCQITCVSHRTQSVPSLSLPTNGTNLDLMVDLNRMCIRYFGFGEKKNKIKMILKIGNLMVKKMKMTTGDFIAVHMRCLPATAASTLDLSRKM